MSTMEKIAASKGIIDPKNYHLSVIIYHLNFGLWVNTALKKPLSNFLTKAV
jgi:hypothetical protein